jgi:two-component system CheB/CheR fusion protein
MTDRKQDSKKKSAPARKRADKNLRGDGNNSDEKSGDNARSSGAALEPAGFAVVGIGASAGGLKALRELLAELPEKTGMAYVLIQHLSPKHESSLPEILAKCTSMGVKSAENGQRLEPNVLSIIPPGYSLLLKGYTLHLEKRDQPAGLFQPIDRFFVSMADALQEKAVAVVLSGSSSDGAQGIIAVRSAGGLTMAQSEATAEYSSMPQQALLTNKVDFTGSAGQIGKLLGEIASHPHLKPHALTRASSLKPEEVNALERVVGQLLHLGADFSDYKPSTVRRRIFRRMALNRVHTVEDYLEKVQKSADELEALKEDLLIKVTSFFRDREVFTALEKQTFPALFENREAEQPVRIWVPGCASGEEVYSLAITLLEFLSGREHLQPIQIFGTDLSELAIEKARQGVYSKADLAEVEPALVDKYFHQKDNEFQIRKIVRELSVFARQDFTQDPPFSRLDLISCRNVLIYLGPALQKRVLPLFHYALSPGGYLLLGQSESIGQHDGLF